MKPVTRCDFTATIDIKGAVDYTRKGWSEAPGLLYDRALPQGKFLVLSIRPRIDIAHSCERYERELGSCANSPTNFLR